MHGWMDANGSMMWGMGWSGVLFAAVIVLGILALAKYVFSKNR
jgi:hypothetical protein